jgi:CRP/FNR family transcriptional regulator/CRP/FNR family cyclic AMP-dependent transcriptional regulator
LGSLKNPEALALLSRTRLFGGLPAADLEQLLPGIRSRRFATQSYIFREGDSAHQLHLIVSGAVKICRVADSGSEVAFAILGPGDVFGEIGVLEEDGTRSADAQALATTECLVIDRRIVVHFVKSHPEAMWRIVTTLSAYVRAKDDAYAELAFQDIPSRVARKLLDLAAEGKSSAATSTMKLSQRDLAGLVGGSRENVNRALRRFASLGYIKLERGRVSLLRPDQLRSRAR